MKISFHGGARDVTGACYLLDTGRERILVDCGLFQGPGDAAEQNVQPFPFDPARVGALVVTHAHLDHVGRIPKLVAQGFSGAIFSTAPTRDLGRLILEDAQALDERRPGKDLYARQDVEQAFSLWQTADYYAPFSIGGARVRLTNAGHILGSAMVEMEIGEKKIVFTGDIGNVPSILLPDPDPIADAAHLVIESTYGNRRHEAVEERTLLLERAVEDSAARRGALLIPAFATERTQEILHLLNEMILFKRVPDIPVFVDAPLAIRITDVFSRYPAYYHQDIQKLYAEHRNLFRFKRLRFTESVEDSKAINEVPPPKVIIAGSGMMTGGRILHHAKRSLPDERSILLITGYQAAGSLGRRLIDGEREVKIHDETIPVRAEIRKINGLSAHADNPQLFSFVERTKDTLKHVFVVQGEEASAMHFAQEIRDRLGVPADAPVQGQEFEF